MKSTQVRDSAPKSSQTRTGVPSRSRHPDVSWQRSWGTALIAVVVLRFAVTWMIGDVSRPIPTAITIAAGIVGLALLLAGGRRTP